MPENQPIQKFPADEGSTIPCVGPATATSACAVLRGFFSEDLMGLLHGDVICITHGNADEGSTTPLKVHAGSNTLTRIEQSVETINLKHGAYYAIWTISLVHFDTTIFQSLCFDSEDHTNDYSNRRNVIMEISITEIEAIKKHQEEANTSIVRVRAPMQVWIDGLSEELRLRIQCYAQDKDWTEVQIQESYLEVHHVELHPALCESTDKQHEDIIILKGSAESLQTIDVCHNDPTNPSSEAPRPARIAASQVNGDGTHVATLSFTETQAHIDLWRLNNSLASDPEVHRVPCATADFTISRDNAGNAPPLEIALSHDVSRIAIFPSATLDRKLFPDVPGFQLLEYSTTFVPALEPLQEKQRQKKDHAIQAAFQGSLISSTTACVDPALQGFAGYGKFHFLDNQDKREEVFVACDGYAVSVYSTRRRWSRLFRLDLTLPPDPVPLPGSVSAEINEGGQEYQQTDAKKCLEMMHRSAKTLVESLQGPLCAWRTAMVFTVFNLQTGEHVSDFIRDLADDESHVAFSPDGAMAVVTEGAHAYIHMLHSQTSLEPQRSNFHSAVKKVLFVDQGRQILIYLDERPAILTTPSNINEANRHVFIPSSNDCDVAVVQAVLKTEEEKQRTSMTDVIIFTHGSRITVQPLQQSVVYARVKNPSIVSTVERRCEEECQMGRRLLNDRPQECTSPSGLQFRLQFYDSDNLYLDQPALWQGQMDLTTKAVLLAMTDPDSFTDERVIQKIFHYGRYGEQSAAYFLPCRTRFIIEGGFYLQLWKLPTDPQNSACELLLMKSIPLEEETSLVYDRMPEANVCCHGQTVHFNDGEGCFGNAAIAGTWIELSEATLSDPVHAEACINSVPFMIGLYSKADESYRKALLRYAIRHINSYPDPSDRSHSVIQRILESKAAEEWSGYGLFLEDLLAYNAPERSWVPRGPIGKRFNPISSVLEAARTRAVYLALARTLIDYCANTAKHERDIGFLSPVIEALPEMMEQQPDLALDAMRKMAFVPTSKKSHTYVVNRSLVCSPPTIRRLLTPNPEPIPIEKCSQPVFQTQRLIPSQQKTSWDEMDASKYTGEVYVATFDMLWAIETAKVKMGDKTIWWKSLAAMLFWKAKPKGYRYVRPHAFMPEFLDNPAIAALLEYKWNTFAGWYWVARFVFQCMYYLLVLITTMFQVYQKDYQLQGAFIAIIVVASVFIWLEFLQFMMSPMEYITSPYNYVDIGVFVLPLASSVIQLAENALESASSNSRAFSFTILVIYLHLLFELRVIKSVCNIVTIILSVVKKIKVFFIIFAASIFAFTHAFVHLLWANASPGDSTQAADFPRPFAKALSATYFFMGGRLDPVSDKFASDDTAFHIMMAIYFFLTVILMLNVLIALINVAFNTGDDSWRLTWYENRFHYAEKAENMSFHVPGFRRTHHWFPSVIYYTTTAKEVQKYHDKYFGNSKPVPIAPITPTTTMTTTSLSSTSNKEPNLVKLFDRAAPTTLAATATSERTEDIERRLERMEEEFQTSLKRLQQEADKKHEELLDLLRQQQRSN